MRIIFWFGIVATLILTMMPSQSIPTAMKFWDKAQHALAFFMLMLTGCVAYSKQVTWLFIGLFLYGASIEIMQTLFTSTRSGEVADLVADTVGVIVAWCVFLMIDRFKHQKS